MTSLWYFSFLTLSTVREPSILMAVYKVHEQRLGPLLTAEFIYETSPVLAGTDDLSLLVRFKYTGEFKEAAKETPAKESELEQKETNDTSSSWFGSRLSSQFSNATRSLFLNGLNAINEDEEDKSLIVSKQSPKVEIFLGFSQLLGYYSVNDTVIDFEIFKDLQKSTIIEGKMAGIHGLEVSVGGATESTGVLSSLGALYSSEMSSLDNLDLLNHLHTIPFFSTDQNIIFSSLTFDPSQWTNETYKHEGIKSFYLTAKLPQELPPTFTSDPIQITYNFVFGYQILENNQLVNKTCFIPLKIQPYVDFSGRQNVFHLETTKLNQKLENVKCIDVSNHRSIKKHDSLTKGKRISFWNIKNKNLEDSEFRRPSTATTFESLKKMSISDVKDIKGTENIEKFMAILEDMQSINVNDIATLQTAFDKQFNDNETRFNVRENLIQILGDSRNHQYHQQGKDDISNEQMEHLIPVDIQTKFSVKQNHHLITTLSLNKGVFKVGDSINLNLSFEDAKYYTTGIEVQLLKHQHFYREEYLKLDNYDAVNSILVSNNTLENVLYEGLHSTFHTTNFNTDILIPYETEPQFKTNFFSLKYYVQVKFIMSDVYGLEKRTIENEEELPREKFDLKKIFVDYRGSVLYQPVETCGNANEFIVRIPVFVLSNYELDFGKVTLSK